MVNTRMYLPYFRPLILERRVVSAGVAVVLMYPIALEVFEICDVPKKFILGVLAAGSFTFLQSMPGSPQVGNAAAMTSLGTAADAALIPGLVGVAVEIAAILVLMNLMINWIPSSRLICPSRISGWLWFRWRCCSWHSIR